MPLELIDKIIDFTNYKKLIQRTGLCAYTNWSINNNNKKLTYLDSSDDDTSDNDSNDGASMSDG